MFRNRLLTLLCIYVYKVRQLFTHLRVKGDRVWIKKYIDYTWWYGTWKIQRDLFSSLGGGGSYRLKVVYLLNRTQLFTLINWVCANMYIWNKCLKFVFKIFSYEEVFALKSAFCMYFYSIFNIFFAFIRLILRNIFWWQKTFMFTCKRCTWRMWIRQSCRRNHIIKSVCDHIM